LINIIENNIYLSPKITRRLVIEKMMRNIFFKLQTFIQNPLLCRSDKIVIFCLFSSLLLTPLVYLTIPATSNAAAWTQGEGNGQAIFSIDSYRTSHSLDKDFNPTTSTNKFSKYAFNPYIEYGVPVASVKTTSFR